MNPGRWLKLRRGIVFLAAGCLAAAGCNSLPGLRVLTGQDTSDTAQSAQTVESLDLVMADKSGTSDPALYAAADRIEAASGNVDVIEIHQDVNARVFDVVMIFRPPQTDNTQQGILTRIDALRRAIELAWQATFGVSEESDTLRVTLVGPAQIDTLDNGPSFVGLILAQAQISRGDAAVYLSRPHTITDFVNLIADGKLDYTQPDTQEFYSGQPNHPMFMLPTPSTN